MSETKSIKTIQDNDLFSNKLNNTEKLMTSFITLLMC